MPNPGQFANAFPAAQPDGILYANAVPLTGQEADLFNGNAGRPGLDPANVLYGQAVLAIVKFAVTGTISSNTSYVVMQTDLNGDGNWIDVAWCRWTGTTGTALFALSNGLAAANAFQQTRAAGTDPGNTGVNAMQLGGRIRFVGKGTFGQGSSSSSSSGPGPINGVTVSITHKLLGLR